jgi:hypothetical protein
MPSSLFTIGHDYIFINPLAVYLPLLCGSFCGAHAGMLGMNCTANQLREYPVTA